MTKINQIDIQECILYDKNEDTEIEMESINKIRGINCDMTLLLKLKR